MAGTGVDALDMISWLREDSVDEWISFPHFVICGQVSAKSALLKALLGVDLRLEDGEEIGFVTEVCSRKSNEDQPFKASLRFRSGSDVIPDVRKGSTCSGYLDATLDTWPTILKAFKIDLSSQKPNEGCSVIARLDVQGPHLFNFDFVYLPTAVNSNNKVLSHLVSSQLTPRRRTLLAVFSDKQDSSSEGVMSLLQQVDPLCKRTIFLLDCASLPIGAKVTHLRKHDLVNINRGWHLVQKHDTRRLLFESQPAPYLPGGPAVCELKDMIDSCNHLWSLNMQRMLPDMLVEIQTEQQICDAELARLGPTRKTSMDQQNFLLMVHAKFKALVDEGVEGRYKSDYFQVGEHRRLRNIMRKLSNGFAVAMQDHGHTYHVTDLMPLFRNPLTSFVNLQSSPSTYITAAGYVEKIHDLVLSSNQSYELPGCYSPLHIGPLFRLHSANWRNFAAAFAEEAFCMTERFLCDVLNGITDYSNESIIWKAFIKPSLDKRKDSLAAKIEELVRPFVEFEPWARPAIYEKRVQYWEEKTRDIGLPTEKLNGKNAKALKACLELLVNMLAYYTGALEAFINNMISLAVEGCLLRELSAVFNLEEILAANIGELKKHTSESSELSSKRASILQQRGKLSSVHGVLQKIAENEAFCSFKRITTDIEQGQASPEVEDTSQDLFERGLRDLRIAPDEIQYEVRSSDSQAELGPSAQQQDGNALHSATRSFPRRSRRYFEWHQVKLPSTTSNLFAPPTNLQKFVPSFSSKTTEDEFKPALPQLPATSCSSNGTGVTKSTDTSCKNEGPNPIAQADATDLSQCARPVIPSLSPQGLSLPIPSSRPFSAPASPASLSRHPSVTVGPISPAISRTPTPTPTPSKALPAASSVSLKRKPNTVTTQQDPRVN